ncbi:TetR/AcrR family transcriptional regulator [Jatrophihabitans fulvus]
MTGSTTSHQGGRQRQFTNDDILRATVALIETEGLGKLTMRRLGAALGVEAMAIYRYFPSRQSLVNALVDWIVLQTAMDPELQFDETDDWRDYLDRLAHGIRQMALTHPRVFPLIATTPTEAPWIRPPMRSLQWVESFLVGLQDHHFPPPAAVTVYKQFSSFLLGHLLLEVAALGLDDDPIAGAPRSGNDEDRSVARAQRSEQAEKAERAMRDGDGPDAEEILEASDSATASLAEEPVVIAAEPQIAHETEAAVQAADAPVDAVSATVDLPLAAAVPSTTGLDLEQFPQVQALAGLLAQDTAPGDFERQLDRLLDDLETLRRP